MTQNLMRLTTFCLIKTDAVQWLGGTKNHTFESVLLQIIVLIGSRQVEGEKQNCTDIARS